MDLKEMIISTTYESFSAIENILNEVGAQDVTTEVFKDEEGIRVKGYFKLEELTSERIDKIRYKIEELKDFNLDIGDINLRVNKLKEEDWTNKWKKYIKPIKITDRIIIKPTWEEYKVKDNEIIIEIDPGQAFGTGDHGTTHGCLEMLEEYIEPGNSILDIGTGTGVLSIAASKLGGENILGVDLDPVAIRVAQENAKLNQLTEEIEFKEGDLVQIVDTQYDLILANILPHIIIRLIPDLLKVSKLGSIVILSGIIEEKKEDVKEKLKEYNFAIKEIVEKDNWITIVAVRS